PDHTDLGARQQVEGQVVEHDLVAVRSARLLQGVDELRHANLTRLQPGTTTDSGARPRRIAGALPALNLSRRPARIPNRAPRAVGDRRLVCRGGVSKRPAAVPWRQASGCRGWAAAAGRVRRQVRRGPAWA